MEDNGLWQILLAAPDDPAQSRVHQTITAVNTQLDQQGKDAIDKTNINRSSG